MGEIGGVSVQSERVPHGGVLGPRRIFEEILDGPDDARRWVDALDLFIESGDLRWLDDEPVTLDGWLDLTRPVDGDGWVFVMLDEATGGVFFGVFLTSDPRFEALRPELERLHGLMWLDGANLEADGRRAAYRLDAILGRRPPEEIAIMYGSGSNGGDDGLLKIAEDWFESICLVDGLPETILGQTLVLRLAG